MQRSSLFSPSCLLALLLTLLLTGCSGAPAGAADPPPAAPAPAPGVAPPPAEATGTQPEKRVVRDADGLNLRESPSMEGKIITVLPKGEVLEVLESKAPWLRVKTARGSGWVSGEYTDPFSAQAVAPAPAQAPAPAAKLLSFCSEVNKRDFPEPLCTDLITRAVKAWQLAVRADSNGLNALAGKDAIFWADGFGAGTDAVAKWAAGKSTEPKSVSYMSKGPGHSAVYMVFLDVEGGKAFVLLDKADLTLARLQTGQELEMD